MSVGLGQSVGHRNIRGMYKSKTLWVILVSGHDAECRRYQFVVWKFICVQYAAQFEAWRSLDFV